MGDSGSQQNFDEDVETAILDAELFIKYKAPQKALERLQQAVGRNPRSTRLREKLREVALACRQPDEAARQCLALASLYIAREDFESAHDRLLQSKQIDPRISITTGLEAIRRARRPDLQPSAPPAEVADSTQTAKPPRPATLAGDLSAISIFDLVQVVENARLTGALIIESAGASGRVLFNDGQIVGAEADGETEAPAAFRRLLEITTGAFDFERTAQSFPVQLNASSNTSLILDSLREIDEGKQ
ncbi:MAG TPA: DUF4388 domain-containing protein [Pyrinomonadaceae bacterium]